MITAPQPDRRVELQRAMRLIAEAVAQDVGCAEAGRIFARLGDLLTRGLQPPMAQPIPLTGFDA